MEKYKNGYKQEWALGGEVGGSMSPKVFLMDTGLTRKKITMKILHLKNSGGA